MKLAVSIAVSL